MIIDALSTALPYGYRGRHRHQEPKTVLQPDHAPDPSVDPTERAVTTHFEPA
ncbi:hypothetical protein ACQPYK_44395 [Streptosporangium sp. CA-135522]|uniref:hypothetical protein n=1 Tax=Streptosporangium sp. CA-135522 TaxID=3240072 RepID=UPI003D89D852